MLINSVLVESKASLLVFGMGEKAVIEIVDRLEKDQPLDGIRGTAILLGKKQQSRSSIRTNT